MESSRFFVTNLPTETTENDLGFLFQDYGRINNIEIKTKENLVDPDDVKIIAFVTLNIAAAEARVCLNDLNRKKIHGQNVKVFLAKESFLERLKREREEEKALSCKTLPVSEKTFEQQSDLLKAPHENQRKVFDVYAELDEEEVAPELMISKKRAANSIYKGKIIIQSQDLKPIHVIETKHKKKRMDTKSSNADKKRKESLNKMKNQYHQNKLTIQQALQELNGNSAKKIKFSDAESDQDEKEPQEYMNKSKTDIFACDNDSDGDSVDFKTSLGIKGEKLVNLQANQSLDLRFRIDAKFLDDEEEDSSAIIGSKEQENFNGDTSDLDNERQWQINIAEQVMGTKLDRIKNPDKAQNIKKMLRYDPSKDEHKKFERIKADDTQIKKSKKSKSSANDAVDESRKSNAVAPAEVSKEVFYVVSDTLKNSLRNRGEGFSLLNMFAKSEHLDQRDKQLKQLGNEKIFVNKKLDKLFTENPFGYDSSSESENEPLPTEQENGVTEGSGKSNMAALKHKKKNFIATESFFIPKNDKRLKEGAKFFIYKKNDDVKHENYEEVRNRLKLLIKTKITKTKKNLANAGCKGKRKV